MNDKKFLKGDVFGGVVSAFVALPLTLACGILLFKSIPSLTQFGINSAIYSAIIASLISVFIGSHKLQISGPRVAITLILADYLLSLHTKLNTSFDDINLIIIVFMMACVVLSGLFQIIFAYLRLGDFIKYLPTSVTIGVSATIGLLIVFKQFPLVFNSSSELLSTSSFSLLAILILMLFVLFSKEIFNTKISSKILNLTPLLAPAFGIGLFYLLFTDNKSEYLLDNISITLPTLDVYWNSFINIFLNFSSDLLKDNIFDLFLTALSIAIISSLSSLLSVTILEEKQKSINSNPALELKGQGLGNIISGIFAGMPSAGSEARGLSNYNSGGRTKISVAVHSLCLFLIVFIFNEYLLYIPEVVLIALLIHIGLFMTFPLLKLGRNICISCAKNKEGTLGDCIKDIVQTFMVVAVMLFTAYIENISTSIVAGFAAASILFIYEMMKNTNYNVISCDNFHSKKVRPSISMNTLKDNGSRIKIIELEGAIFFGTADALRDVINSLESHSKYIIIDFRKVTEMDITGAQILKLCVKDHPNISFYLSHIRIDDDTYQALCPIGLVGKGGLPWYENTDFALEEVEEDLLSSLNIEIRDENRVLSLNEISLTKNLDKNELETLEKYLELKKYKKDEYLFQENNPSLGLFFLKKGEVSIWAKQLESSNKKDLSQIRRITFTSGVVIGEMAFFENIKHKVSAKAQSDIEVYYLSKDSFEKLSLNEVVLTQKIMFEICSHISKRLREVSLEVQVLERWE